MRALLVVGGLLPLRIEGRLASSIQLRREARRGEGGVRDEEKGEVENERRRGWARREEQGGSEKGGMGEEGESVLFCMSSHQPAHCRHLCLSARASRVGLGLGAAQRGLAGSLVDLQLREPGRRAERLETEAEKGKRA